jgi:hypothetical protein
MEIQFQHLSAETNPHVRYSYAASEILLAPTLGCQSLTPKILGPFLPISTSKMLIYLKKSPKKFKNLKNAEIFNPRKIMIYQIYSKNLVKKY